MAKRVITFVPGNIQLVIEEDINLFVAAHRAGIRFETPCGGNGTCGKCMVWLPNEGKWVRACETEVTKDLVVEIPFQNQINNGKAVSDQTNYHWEIKHSLSNTIVIPQCLEEPKSSVERMLEAVNNKNLHVPLEVLQQMSAIPQNSDTPSTVVLNNTNVLAIEQGNTSNRLIGMTLDIGTTTIAAALIDLQTGNTLATLADANPQCVFGADVVTRMEYAMEPKGLAELQEVVISAINKLIVALAEKVGIKAQEIYQMCVAGNTTMTHLFLGLSVNSLAQFPFAPTVTTSVKVRAQELNLQVCPRAEVYIMPSIAGYVGGDTVGVILATGIYEMDKPTLVVDIGTNGEIILAANNQLYAASTAAGPAFEGARIEFGMRATLGAIEGVKITDDIELEVIGGGLAKGLCGSGLLDLAANLIKVGIVEKSGLLISNQEAKHLPHKLRQRLKDSPKGTYFIVEQDPNTGEELVVLTQRDLRELQLAKAAIRGGIETLLKEAEITNKDIQEVFLAGTFGSYISKESALMIGLLPPISEDRIKFAGNAAELGAKMILLSDKSRMRAEIVAVQTKHVELSLSSDFQEEFIDRLTF